MVVVGAVGPASAISTSCAKEKLSVTLDEATESSLSSAGKSGEQASGNSLRIGDVIAQDSPVTRNCFSVCGSSVCGSSDSPVTRNGFSACGSSDVMDEKVLKLTSNFGAQSSNRFQPQLENDRCVKDDPTYVNLHRQPNIATSLDCH